MTQSTFNRSFRKRHSKNVFVKWMKKWYQEFCLGTGQHGYKYLAQPGLHLIERVLWLLLIIICTVVAAYIVNITWAFNVAHPTLTVVESYRYNVMNIPFPAVTICSVNQLKRSIALNLSRTLMLSGVPQDQVLQDLRLLSEFFDFEEETSTANLTRMQRILDTNNLTINAVMQLLTPSCSQMLVRCMWKGQIAENCVQLFQDIKTYEGVCCTFNYNGLNDNIKMLVPRKPTQRFNNVRISACGYRTGLSIVLDNQVEDYFDTFLASRGFKVMIHSNYEYPDPNAVEMILSIGEQVFMAVTPTETYATESVRDKSVKQRQCRFQDEVFSSIMKTYSYNNCIMECRKNYTIDICKCYPFYYPDTDTGRTCNLTDIPCLSKNKYHLQAIRLDDYEKDFGSFFGEIPTPCGCLPECHILNYRIQMTRGVIESGLTLENKNNFYDDLESGNYSMLHVFFADLTGGRYRKDHHYGWLDLMASIGGILSLMLGFSLMNGFEFIYFFTLRLWVYALCNGREADPAHTSAVSPTLANNNQARPTFRGAFRQEIRSTVKVSANGDRSQERKNY